MKSIPMLHKFIAPFVAIFTLFSCGDSDPEPVDCATTGPELTVNGATAATCGQDNGTASITLAGGSGALEFSIDGSAFQSIPSGSTTIEGLPSGTLALTVRDDNNCTANANLIIGDVNDLMVEANTTTSGCNTTSGSVAVTASGGAEPYSYSLDGGASQSDNNFTSLGAGEYTVLVTDDDGCETSTTVTVLTGVSYMNEIQLILENDCAISGCHDGNTAGLPNWNDLATVQSNAANIKARTGNGTMPPAGRPELEPSEIDAIACWVDDGALDN